MKIFMKDENYQAWRVIGFGDYELTITNSWNEVILVLMSDYEKEDFEKMKMNSLAMKFFI